MAPESSPHPDSFRARSTLAVGAKSYEIFSLHAEALTGGHDIRRLPYSIKVLLENLLRHEDGIKVTAADIEAVAGWGRQPEAHGANAGDDAHEIALSPERVLMQDFTGVPAVVDLAAMRDALAALGGDAARINPLVPVELVIDHSVIAERSGSPGVESQNVRIEYERNVERYQLLRWAQGSFDGLRVVPPGTGICHQVNLEHLSRVVFATASGEAFCDTLVGTDSHTTMVNGLGVLGWGVGGIEAEAAMLGQPLSMLLPPVVGLRLYGQLPEGTTATDLVLTITELLRAKGVVGAFVEAYGPGVAAVPVENRATIGNMSPEYGATCTVFPIDTATIDYLRFTGRERGAPRAGGGLRQGAGALARPGARTRVLRHRRARPFDGGPKPCRTRTPPGSGGPGRSRRALPGRPGTPRPERPRRRGRRTWTAPTRGRPPCATATWSSLPSRAAPTRRTPRSWWPLGCSPVGPQCSGCGPSPGSRRRWRPGSRVVMDYLGRAGLIEPLETLGFYLVGFGCTTCIGNSGPLLPGISEAVRDADLSVVSVLSGNRNFEGRIDPDVRLNYLASPPLVVAYALAGTMDIDLATDPIGTATDGTEVRLADLWPTEVEVAQAIRSSLSSEEFRTRYASVFDGDELWRSVTVAEGETFSWDDGSTYVLRPPFFDTMQRDPSPVTEIHGARVLAVLGDSVTTDHISPAGSIGPNTPAGRYLVEHGVTREDFNSYGARRGNHEVMMRGTFANVRLRNQLAPGTEGGVTLHLPEGDRTTIYEASMRYQADGVPLVVLAGKEYGSGSSRDWAAKGTKLLGVSAVLAESYERIHRSNLVGMGVLPLQYLPDESAATLGLNGHELLSISGLLALNEGMLPKEVTVGAVRDDGSALQFGARVRIDTPMEAEYYRHGGILQYVLRQLAG